MTVHAAKSECESVIKITGIGCFLTKEVVASWLKEHGINFKELHLGLREGDKKTVKAFVVVDNEDDSDKMFQLNDSTFSHKVVHVYHTERRQLDRMLEVTGLTDCTVRLMHLPPVVTKVDIEALFEGLEIATNGIYIPSRTPRSSGEAYVQFTNKEDAMKALKKHGEMLIGSRLIITRSSVKQRELAELRTAQQLNANTSPGKGKKKIEDTHTTVSQLEGELSSNKLLKMTGFSRETTTQDVLEWLKEDDIVAYYVLFFAKPGAKPMKIAYVVTGGKSDVNKGLQKDGQYLDNRYINAFRVTDPELRSLQIKTRVVYVANLPDNATEKGLFSFFSGYGARVTKTMMPDDSSNEAYVEFQSPQSAEEALKKNGTQYGYNNIFIQLSLAKEMSDLLPVGNAEEESQSEEDEPSIKIEPNMVKLSGLKKKTSEEKIWEWFTDDDMRVAAVNVQKNGVAYVTLENEDDIEAALSKNNTKLKNRVIEVSLAKDPKEASPKKKVNVEGCGYVWMKGVSFSIKETEIRNFFDGLQIPKGGVFMERRSNGFFTGTAMIQFTSPNAAVEAIKKHRQYLGDRFVLIHPAKPEEWVAATSKEEVKMLPFVKPQPLSVPEGSSLYKLSGLPWSAARKEIIDFFAVDGVEVKEVYLWWKDISSGIAFVAVDEDDGTKVQRKHKSMMDDRMISVFPVNKLEFLSAMQLVESQDNFALLRGLAFETSAKDIVQFFEGLEIEDFGIYVLPDFKEINEVVVQFKREDARREALKKDRCYIGPRYARVFPCKMHHLNLLRTSTRVEDMTSTASLFPHLVAMKSASEGNFHRPTGMEVNRGGGRPFERERGVGSFRRIKQAPEKSEPPAETNEGFNWNIPQVVKSPFVKEERKRKSSEMAAEEEHTKSTGEKKKRKRISEGDVSSHIVDEKPAVENLKSEKTSEISISLGKKNKRKRSVSGGTSFVESTIEVPKQEKKTPAQPQSRKRKKSEKVSQKLLEPQEDESYNIALMMADGLFRKGGGNIKEIANMMEKNEDEENESTPNQGKKKKKRRQSIGFVEQDKADEATIEAENSFNENILLSPKKKKKHQKMGRETTEDHLEPSSGRKKKKH